MCDVKETDHGWLDLLIPKITSRLGKVFDGARYELTVPGDSFFLSSMFFVTFTARTDAKDSLKKNTVSVVIKRPPQEETIKELINADAQFHNEILFYERYSDNSEDYPRSVYVNEKPPIGLAIVLENVKERGYTVSPKKWDVSLEGTVAAMKGIGRFHGKGYAMKERQSERFFDIVRNIQESRYKDEPDDRFVTMINATSTRAVDYLRNRGQDKLFWDKVYKFLDNAYENVMINCVRSEELATLCHGDFTMNNVLFKRNDDGPKAMLIDFALMRYGSPVIDLSTLLCLCCMDELAVDRFDSILRVYHDSLMEFLRENQLESRGRFAYETIRAEFRKHGLLGFVIASFFLPMMMGKSEIAIEDIMNMDAREVAMKTREAGGDEISEILANLLVKLRDLGCLEHVV